MKTAQSLCAALTHSHTFRPLSRHRCYRAFLEMLPPRFRQAIAFVTIKNDQLMVALTHPGLKMELNYNQELLKSLLSTLRTHRPECAFMRAEKVVVFLSRYHRLADAAPEPSVPHYREQATGEFSESPSHPELAESLERIRHWILKNREATPS